MKKTFLSFILLCIQVSQKYSAYDNTTKKWIPLPIFEKSMLVEERLQWEQKAIELDIQKKQKKNLNLKNVAEEDGPVGFQMPIIPNL